MRKYRFLLIFLIISCFFSLTSCEEDTDSFLKEGKYASSYITSNSGDDFTVEDYTLIYCEIKKVDENYWKNSSSNVIYEKINFEIVYFSVDILVKKYDMDYFAKMTLTEVTLTYNKNGVDYLTGNMTFDYNGEIINDRFELYTIAYMDCISFSSSYIDEFLNHEEFSFNLHEYEYKFKSSKSKDFTDAKLSIKEINMEDYKWGNINQFQAFYGFQCFEIELFVLPKESSEYVKVDLLFERYIDNSPFVDEPPYIYGECYCEMNDELLSSVARLEIDDTEYLRLYVGDWVYFEKIPLNN